MADCYVELLKEKYHLLTPGVGACCLGGINTDLMARCREDPVGLLGDASKSVPAWGGCDVQGLPS